VILGIVERGSRILDPLAPGKMHTWNILV